MWAHKYIMLPGVPHSIQATDTMALALSTGSITLKMLSANPEALNKSQVAELNRNQCVNVNNVRFTWVRNYVVVHFLHKLRNKLDINFQHQCSPNTSHT